MCKKISLLLFFFFHCAAFASNLSLYPIKISISPKDNVAILKIKNVTDAPINVQLDIKRWIQENNEDQYLPSPNAFAIPGIFQLKGQQTQIIRIGIRQKDNPHIETDYRLFIREIPVSVPSSSNTANKLNISLQIALPIFILPESSSVIQYNWKIDEINNNEATISLYNQGNVHLLLTDIHLTNTKGKNIGTLKQLNYILPYNHKTWVIRLDEDIAAENIKIYSNINCEKYIQAETL